MFVTVVILLIIIIAITSVIGKLNQQGATSVVSPPPPPPLFEGSLSMSSGVTAREPQQNYHGAIVYLDLSVYGGKVLHVRTNTGSHHFAAQLWEGHINPDEHAWWINHPW